MTQQFKIDLDIAAETFWENGIVVLPWQYRTVNGHVEKPTNVDAWKQWQSRPQTRQEFEALKLDTADGIGLLCGCKTKSGLYLGALDYDVKPSPSGVMPTKESLELGEKILAEMPPTRMEQTQSGGVHAYYLSRTPVKTDKTFKDKTAIEFLGAYIPVYVYPSKGYKTLNNHDFTVLNDLQNTFYTILAKHGLEKEEKPRVQSSTAQVHNHLPIDVLRQRNVKLNDLMNGFWKEYKYATRSEGEAAIVTTLIYAGFNDPEIRDAMQNCEIGKWQQAGDAYQDITIRKAREFTAKHPPASLKEVKRVFRERLYLEDDDEIIDIVFACFIDRMLPGDPLWLFLISPSGGTKTEIVRANQTPMAYTLDSLTSHTLISGKLKKNEDGELIPVCGILPSIDGKVLIIKDFTVILAKRIEERDEIFSQLRCLYDGYLEAAFGTLEKPIRVKAQIGLIACTTPVVDQYSKMYVQLGERFLKVRHHPNSEKATAKAMENLGKEEQLREELAFVTDRFLRHLKVNVEDIKNNFSLEIQKMAQATAILRTPVSINFWRYEINSSLTPSIEYPTRLSKQLLKLAYALAVVRGKNEVTNQELETVRRVARDTCYPNRIKIIKTMKTNKQYTTRNISEKTGIPLSSCWRELKELEYLNVIEYNRFEDSNSKHQAEKDGWTLPDNSLKILLPRVSLVSQTSGKGGMGVNKAKGSLESSETETEECSICLGPLPSDLADTTFYNGLLVHVPCFQRLKDKMGGS